MERESETTIEYGNVYSVYVHEFPNGKKYVGITRNTPEKRWRHGQGYRNQKTVYKAIQKYGWNNIKHTIIASNISQQEAGQLERELISKYQTQNYAYGYNVEAGGEVFGEHSEKFLKYMRNCMKGNTYCVGRHISEEHKKALEKGRTPEVMQRIAQSNIGKHHVSDERKSILSESAKQRWMDSEFRRIQSDHHADMKGENNPMFGKNHSDETKAKIREKALGRKASEEARASMRASAHHKKVVRISRDYCSSVTFYSVREAAESVNGNGTNITFACKHPTRTYKGYKWRYV